MTMHPSSGTAGPVAPPGDRQRGRGHGVVSAAVLRRAGLRRHSSRDLWAVAAALAGPLAASAVLLPFRAGWSNTNVALLLVVVVVAVAATGNRLAGALAAVGAAVWFDFFFTLPYYRLTIRSSDDLTTAVLLLVTGLAVSQLAAWARQLRVTAVAGEGYLATMHGTAALAQAEQVGHSYSATGVSAP
jgi:K+-sensing histidine kinase KdpD